MNVELIAELRNILINLQAEYDTAEAKYQKEQAVGVNTTSPVRGHDIFDIGMWFEPSPWKDLSAQVSVITEGTDDYRCGTTCCALGWACLNKKFIAAGLHLDPEYREPVYMGTNGRRYIGVEAGAEVLGIYPDVAACLFIGGHYRLNAHGFKAVPSDRSVQPKDVLARLDQIIERQLIGEAK